MGTPFGNCKNSNIKFLKKSDESKFSVDYQIYELKAPLKKGDKVGRLFVFDENNMAIDETDLILGCDIEGVDFNFNFKNIINLW